MDITRNMAKAKITHLLVFITTFFLIAGHFRKYLFPQPYSQSSSDSVLIVPGATWTAVRYKVFTYLLTAHLK
jgi:hypothetical protein